MENYSEIIRNFVLSMQELVHKAIRTADFDKTFRAIVIEKKASDKYEIEYKGKRYSARCKTPVEAGTIVTVCAPQNKWNELYIQCEGNEDFILNYLDKCVTLSDAQTLTNKRYNGMTIYRVGTSAKNTIYIKNTYSNIDPAHVGGLLFMEQNGNGCIMTLNPSGWNAVLNPNNWSCSYSSSDHQWTIKAQEWSYGWFIPFSDTYTFSITYN